MKKIINFRDKLIKNLTEPIESAYDATDVISHQKHYRVPVELQNLFQQYIGDKKSYKKFNEALLNLDENTKHFLVVAYYLLMNYIYKINDREDLYETLEKFNILPDDEWFVLSSDLNRKIYHYLFPLEQVEIKEDSQYKLF